MGKLVAIKGCQLELSSGEASSVKITTEPSQIIKINKMGVYFGEVEIEISGFTSSVIGTWVSGSGSGKGKLKSTALAAKSTFTVIREGDESESITIKGQMVAPNGSIISAQDSVKVKISQAGQTLVKAD